MRRAAPNDYAYIINTTPAMWENTLTTIGRADLINDPRFHDQKSRNEHFDAVFAIIADWTKQRDKFSVMEAFGQAGVPCGAVLDSGDILANEHLKERGMITHVEHPTRGGFTMPGCAVQMSDSPAEVQPAPLLGAAQCRYFRLPAGSDGRRFGGTQGRRHYLVGGPFLKRDTLAALPQS